MPIKTLKLTGTFDHQSKLDPAYNTPEASVFTLRVLDSRVMGQIRDASMSLAQVNSTAVDTRAATILSVHESNFKTCQFGIVGWRNVEDDEGSHVEFKTVEKIVGNTRYMVADPDVLMTLPEALIDELALAIKTGNVVTVAEVKNSNAS